MATRGLDPDPGIRMTFLGGTNEGDDGTSYVNKSAYDSIHSKVKYLNAYYGTHCPRSRVVRTNLRHIFHLFHQREIGHPISNRAELTCQGVDDLYR